MNGDGYGGRPPQRPQGPPPRRGGGPGWAQQGRQYPPRPLPDTEVIPRGGPVRAMPPQNRVPDRVQPQPPARQSYRPPRRRPRWGRRIGTTLAVIVVLLLAFAVYVDTTLSRTGALLASDTSSSGTNWLIVGSDSRQKLTEEEKKLYATGDEVSQLTDTIMILHTGSAPTTLVSIPRDSQLNIPGFGVSKVNSAYGKGGGPDGGGPALLVKTIEQATGLHIDHYAEIGFLGIVKVVDAVGGVELDVPESIKDPKAALDIKAGPQVLDGKTALGYVRTRATATSDFGRVQRQRALLSALLDKVTAPTTLINPFRIVPLANGLSSAITVDDGDHVWNLAQLGLAMRGVSGGISTTVPVADGEVHWDKQRASAFFGALEQDEAPPSTSYDHPK